MIRPPSRSMGRFAAKNSGWLSLKASSSRRLLTAATRQSDMRPAFRFGPRGGGRGRERPRLRLTPGRQRQNFKGGRDKSAAHLPGRPCHQKARRFLIKRRFTIQGGKKIRRRWTRRACNGCASPQATWFGPDQIERTLILAPTQKVGPKPFASILAVRSGDVVFTIWKEVTQKTRPD